MHIYSIQIRAKRQKGLSYKDNNNDTTVLLVFLWVIEGPLFIPYLFLVHLFSL